MDSDCDSPSTCNEFLCTDGDESQTESILSHCTNSFDGFQVNCDATFDGNPSSTPAAQSTCETTIKAELDLEKVNCLLTAIRRIRAQKQRPCIERIMCVLRSMRSMTKDDVEEQLALACKEGLIICDSSRGAPSYKDPKMVVSLKTRRLQVGRHSDLMKVVVRTVRELGSSDGSTLADIHHFIRTAYSVDVTEGCDLSELVSRWCQLAAKCGRLTLNGDRFKAVHFNSDKQTDEKRNSGDLAFRRVLDLVDKAFQTLVSTVNILVWRDFTKLTVELCHNVRSWSVKCTVVCNIRGLL